MQLYSIVTTANQIHNLYRWVTMLMWTFQACFGCQALQLTINSPALCCHQSIDPPVDPSIHPTLHPSNDWLKFYAESMFVPVLRYFKKLSIKDFFSLSVKQLTLLRHHSRLSLFTFPRYFCTLLQNVSKLCFCRTLL